MLAILGLVIGLSTADEGIKSLQKNLSASIKANSKACYVIVHTANSPTGLGCTENQACVLSSIKLLCDADAPATTGQEFRGAYDSASYIELHHRVVTTSSGTMVGLGKRIVSCDSLANADALANVTDCLLQDE